MSTDPNSSEPAATPQPGRVALALGVAALVFVLDQASKLWVLEGLGLRERLRIEVAPFLDFVLAYNTGVNFGLFASGSPSQAWLLAGFAAAVSLGLAIWSARSRDPYLALGCGVVIGGALGNALDRLREGAVVDFINVDCCGIGNPYAFNLADCAIFLGAAIIALYAWRDEPEASPAAAEPSRGEKRPAPATRETERT